jgi:hypothetical protein
VRCKANNHENLQGEERCMNTTNLFVELVVIGVGAVFSFGLILLTLFGYDWIAWEKITSSVMIIPFLSITYAIGIVVDRLADRLYFNYNKKLRLQVFPDNGDVHFHSARTYVYNYCSDSIFSWFSYLTSRLRISRAWSLNCILLGISIFAFVQISWQGDIKA